MWDALTVAHLFKPNMKEWNVNFIHFLFDVITTTQILCTPLISSVYVDKATWRFKKNGIYSVRSAYWDIINNDDTLLQHRIPGQWNAIWKFKLPT